MQQVPQGADVSRHTATDLLLPFGLRIRRTRSPQRGGRGDQDRGEREQRGRQHCLPLREGKDFFGDPQAQVCVMKVRRAVTRAHIRG
ncbi:hypothetical protein [Streptomyces bobili]|uniref:hypothetical protein n=1 Tax=Streptomyces bobili TaxID=67280 RepID=UPI003793B2D5